MLAIRELLSESPEKKIEVTMTELHNKLLEWEEEIESVTALGRQIRGLTPLLKEFDGIDHRFASGGNTRRHTFAIPPRITVLTVQSVHSGGYVQ